MKLKFQDFKELKSFPSGSGIEYYGEKVYLVGDDAKDILVMDKRWKKLDTIPLFENAENRIPKKTKADLEATTIIELNSIPRMLVLGSGSKDLRNKAVLINLDDNSKEEFDITEFYNRLQQSGIKVLNIESAVVILGKLILGNRGSKNGPENNIIVTDVDFWRHQSTCQISVSTVELPAGKKPLAGLSGMAYSHQNDWLIATLSTELTDNPIDDGPIGDSYVAIVENASRKILHKRMRVNELINLAESDKVFRGYKIESVCIQSEKDGRAKLQLVADNDTGSSYLFKVRIKG